MEPGKMRLFFVKDYNANMDNTLFTAVGTGIYNPLLVEPTLNKVVFRKTCQLCGEDYEGGDYYCEKCIKFCEENFYNVHAI